MFEATSNDFLIGERFDSIRCYKPGAGPTL